MDEAAWLDSASRAERIEVQALASTFRDSIALHARNLAVANARVT